MDGNVKTKVRLNTPDSPSLRTTIPLAFAETLRLKPGDTIEWSLETKAGKHILIIEKDEDKESLKLDLAKPT